MPNRMAKNKIKKMSILNAGKDVGKLNHSCIAGEKVKFYSHSKKQFGKFL